MRYILIAFWTLVLSITVANAQDNYRIKPGDTLVVEVLEDASLNRSVLVLPDGSITFPFAGSVFVGGRTVADVQSTITAQIAENFASRPTVFVNVSALRPEVIAPVTGEKATPTISVYFIGEVNQPGMRPMAPGTTFLQAVAESGGMTRFAATKRVQLRRFDSRSGAQQIFTMNLRALGDGGPLTDNVVLQDGDTILVPERRLFE